MRSQLIIFTIIVPAFLMAPLYLTAQCLSNIPVATWSGETEMEICLGSSKTSIWMKPGSAGPYAYAITDEQGNILNVSLKNKIDFASAPPGICRIYGISWWGIFRKPIGEAIDEAEFTDFCYEVSPNYVTVTRMLLGSGTVQTDQGASIVYTCPGDGNPDVVNFTYEGFSEGQFTYIVTDEAFNIIGMPEGTSLDFEGAGEGVCLVWGLNYLGDLAAELGDNAITDELATGCFGLSENNLRIVRAQPVAGMVEMSDGASSIDLCVGDGVTDEVFFKAQGKSPAEFRYVITNDVNEILGLPEGDMAEFDGAGPGTCRVWGVSFTGNFLLAQGQNVQDAMISDGCNDLSSNYVEVVRTRNNGGVVSLRNGETKTYTCTQDDIDDIVTFKHDSASATKYIYIITSPSLEILGIEPADSHNFDGAPPGTCWIYGLAYTGNLTAQVGDNASEVALSDACYDLSDNFIEVVRDVPEGGAVSMPSGAMERYTCAQDGEPDVVMFQNEGASNSKYVYVITSPELEILGIEPADSHDFDDAPPGTCWVWGLAYTGNLTAQIGDNAAAVALSDDCYDLSDNFISVIRDVPDGGLVSTSTGATRVYTCTQDGQADIVSFTNSNASNSPYLYVITSPTLEILGIERNDNHDFDDAPPGTCWVWGLAYTGEITAQVGDNAGEVALSSECFDLSDDFIEVVRDQPEGGTVSMPSGETERFTCTQDGVADIVMFQHEGSSNSDYAYIITSPTLEILGIERNDSHDFDDAPPGTCWVWGLAYTGNIIAQLGDNAGEVNLTSDCYDLSDNYITVTREIPDGGVVMMPSGATRRYTCPQDGVADVVKFQNDSTAGPSYHYVVTTPDLVILSVVEADSFDFDAAPPGTCWVWGLAYSGNIIVEVGDTANQVPLSDECFDLSDNFIEVIRDVPNGGIVSMPSGETTRYTCTQDGTADLVMFQNEGASNSPYVYMITSPTLEILGIETSDGHDFDGAPPGTCWVWGLAYTGSITAQVGENAGEVSLSDGCFDLSDNFIEVIRDMPNGGKVSMPSGETTHYTCTQDGKPDEVMFVNEGASNSKYIYVITSPALEILGIETNDSHDFDDAPPGTCWVWGLAYTGNITAKVGDHAGEVALSDDCFDFSENFIEVIRDNIEGGTLSMPSGDTIIHTCTQDGTADVVIFQKEGSSNSKYVYVITSPTLEILGIESNDSHDFDDAPPGICWVWGLAYTGNITAEIGDNAGAVALTDDCFDLSDNFIEVNRDVPNGGTVATEAGETEVGITVGDGISNVINFTHAGNSNSLFTYVITDDQNKILGIPPGSSNDFEPAGVGICRVWGLAYTGTIIAQVGDNAGEVELSDGCFDLSENFIQITRSATSLLHHELTSGIATGEKLLDLQVINPVHKRLQGTVWTREVDALQIRLFDYQGRMIRTRSYVDPVTSIDLDWNLSDLIPGIYILSVSHSKGVKSKRLVLQ